MNWKTWIGAALLTAMVAVSAAPVRAADGQLQVKTKQGKVEGRMDGDVKTFLGIPFAAPPVGLRPGDRQDVPHTRTTAVRPVSHPFLKLGIAQRLPEMRLVQRARVISPLPDVSVRLVSRIPVGMRTARGSASVPVPDHRLCEESRSSGYGST
jgi:hypothetical protein